MTETKTIAPAAGIRFTVASRPQRRFANTQTISLLTANNYQPIPLAATGFVRKISLDFCVTLTCASAAALVLGDGPFNLISSVTLTDATGQPIYQPIDGYSLYLINKHFPSGTSKPRRGYVNNPLLTPYYVYTVPGATSVVARFRLDLDLEHDADTGYGCIPNLDSNASLQLQVNMNPYGVAMTGTTVSAVQSSLRVTQWYWAPVGSTTGGIANQTAPTGFGDFVETRYENQTATAAAENTVPVNNRGGLVQGIIAVSRAAGVRVPFTPASNVGVVYDNNAIDEGLLLEEFQDQTRRISGNIGADHLAAAGYPPLAAGVLPGIDAGVLVFDFEGQAAGRDTWLSTRPGTLLQLKVTPGAAATQLQLVTRLAQVKDAAAFYYGGL